MARGWTWIDDDTERTDGDVERLTPLLDELAEQWSTLHDQDEQRGWARQAAIEDGEYYGPDFDTDEEAEEFEKSQRNREATARLRIEGIEAQLAHFGARMMRPYEHWNEDERYMEYAERDRDY